VQYFRYLTGLINIFSLFYMTSSVYFYQNHTKYNKVRRDNLLCVEALNEII